MNRMRAFALVGLFVGLTGNAFGQVLDSTLLKDINGIAVPGSGTNSSPTLLTEANGLVFFRATRPDIGGELYRSDGTPNGTILLIDVNPGSAGSDPSNVVEVGNGRVVFSATSPLGRELFVSDGTISGTKLLKDIQPGAGSSAPTQFVRHKDKVWFIANDGVHGAEVWVTDGTEAGTKLEVDTQPGSEGGMNGSLLMASGGKLYASRQVLSLGTVDLQVLTNAFPPKFLTIASFAGIPTSAFFRSYAALDDVVVFLVSNQVFRTDGTSAGTFKLSDAASSVAWIVESNQKIFFGGLAINNTGGEPFVTDGTVARTRMIVDLKPGPGSSLEDFQVPIPFSGGIVFAADDGNGAGRELYFTDGTAGQTHLIADVNAGPLTSSPRLLRAWNNEIYFGAQSSGAGLELHKFNSSLTSFSVLTNKPSPISLGLGYEAGRAEFGLVFPYSGGHGWELWKTDGTLASSVEIKNINPDPTNLASSPDQLTRLGNQVLFTADNGIVGRELWRTDGTDVGTKLVVDMVPGAASSEPSDLTTAADQLFFVANVAGLGREVFKTDGTFAGTSLVVNLAGASTSEPRYLTAVGERLFFTAWDTASVGRELFVTDGTLGGTKMVADMSSVVISSASVTTPPFYLMPFGDRLLFFHNIAGGLELWSTDGTYVGTKFVKDIEPGPAGSVSPPSAAFQFEYVECNGRIFFPARTSANGTELWVTDGTGPGTTLVADIVPGGDGSGPRSLRAVGDHVLFVATEPSTGTELWRTDGTPAGTVVLDIVPGPGSSNPGRITSASDIAMFVRVTSGGLSLHSTDGFTVSFVSQLTDTLTVINPFDTEQVALGQGRDILFANTLFESGSEWWTSDGTTVGTVAVTESAPGAFASEPKAGVRLGDRYIFSATDIDHGQELHSIPVVATSAWVAEPIGSGCQGVGGKLGLVPVGSAVVGKPFGISVDHAAPQASVLLFASATMTGPQSVTDCTLSLLSPIPLGSFLSDANGQLMKVAPLPNNPALVGALFYLQVGTPLLSGPFQGVATFSAPLEVLINS